MVKWEKNKKKKKTEKQSGMKTEADDEMERKSLRDRKVK